MLALPLTLMENVWGPASLRSGWHCQGEVAKSQNRCLLFSKDDLFSAQYWPNHNPGPFNRVLCYSGEAGHNVWTRCFIVNVELIVCMIHQSMGYFKWVYDSDRCLDLSVLKQVCNKMIWRVTHGKVVTVCALLDRSFCVSTEYKRVSGSLYVCVSAACTSEHPQRQSRIW